MLERDNRGIGVDDPAGANVVGSKRVYKIDIAGATDVAARVLPSDGNLAAAVPIVPVTKSPDVFIDLAANTLLPNGKQAEKWEGLTIGPRLLGGAHLILAGNDNDYSVTQQAGGDEQFDVYVDFQRRQRPARPRRADDAGRRGSRPGARRLRPAPRRAARLSRVAERSGRLREAGAAAPRARSRL